MPPHILTFKTIAHAYSVLPTVTVHPSGLRGMRFESFAAWHLATSERGEALSHNGFQGSDSPLRSMWGISRMLQLLDFTHVAQRCAELRGTAQWDESRPPVLGATAANTELGYANGDDAAHAQIVEEMKQRRASLLDEYDARPTGSIVSLSYVRSCTVTFRAESCSQFELLLLIYLTFRTGSIAQVVGATSSSPPLPAASSPLQLRLKRGVAYARRDHHAVSAPAPPRTRNLSSVHRDLNALDLRLAQLSDVAGWPHHQDAHRDAHRDDHEGLLETAAEGLHSPPQPRELPQAEEYALFESPRGGDSKMSGHQRPLPLTRVFGSPPPHSGDPVKSVRPSTALASPPPMVTVEDAARTVVSERLRLKKERCAAVDAMEDAHSAERAAWNAARQSFEERCANAEVSLCTYRYISCKI